MTARSRRELRLPPALTPAEEACWWDEHPDYWDAVRAADEQVAPARVRPTKPVDRRLPVDMLEALRRAAARRALPYQTLIRIWLHERLEAEPPQPDA